jgi:hypothetical protein
MFSRGLQHSFAGKEEIAMQLSTVVASAALVLAAALAVGHALGQDILPPSEPKVTMQKKVDEREAQRRAAAADQQRKKDEFARRCTKALKTPDELEECRVVYRQM